MLRLAVGDESDLEIDDCELKREGPSYTFDTLKRYRSSLGSKAPLYFVMGHDAWLTLPVWYRWSELGDLAHLIVLGRPGEYAKEPAALKNWVHGRRTSLKESRDSACGRVVDVCLEPISVSATQVRQAIACGRPVSDMVPEAVEQYIAERQLYVAER